MRSARPCKCAIESGTVYRSADSGSRSCHRSYSSAPFKWSTPSPPRSSTPAVAGSFTRKSRDRPACASIPLRVGDINPPLPLIDKDATAPADRLDVHVEHDAEQNRLHGDAE